MRTLHEAAATISWVNVKTIGFSLAQLLESRRFWAVVERVGNASLFDWMENTRRWTSKLRRFPAETFDVSFAVLGAFIGMETVGKMFAIVQQIARGFSRMLGRFARDSISVIAHFAIVQQSIPAVFVANNFATSASIKSTTRLRRVWIKSIKLPLTR